MRWFGGALALIAFLLIPILAAACYCDDSSLYTNGGFCINSKVDGKYLCCGPDHTCGQYRCAGYADFDCYAGVAADGTKSDAGTQIVKWTTSSTDISGACSGNAGKPCDVNPIPDAGDKNGWDSDNSEPDRGYCEDDTKNCVKCENGVEKYRWTGGPSISGAGDGKCESSCPGVVAACDEMPKGQFPDPHDDHTIDSCANCGIYSDTDICEADYGASAECDGNSIGYYSGNSGCNSICTWKNCGTYRWNTDTNTCKTSCVNNGDCYSGAVCINSVCLVDTSAPTIIIYTPVQDNTYNISPIALKFIVNDDRSDPVTCEYTLDGSTANLGLKAVATNHTVSVIMPGQGLHTISVNCTDSVGNEGASAEVTFTFAPAAPSISITSPAEGSYINKNENINLTFRPQDSFYPNVTCEYVLDGQAPTDIGTVNSGQYYTTSFNVSSEGSHTIYINCTNAASNEGQSPTVHFTTDVNAPAVTPISPTNNTTYGSQTILLKFQVTDTIDNSLSCRYVLNSNPTQLGNVVNGSTYSIDVNTGRTGYHALYIDCTDDTGNTGSSGTLNFVVDTVAPTVTIQDPQNITYYSDVISDLPVKFTPVDDFDANMTCDYKVNDGDPISRGFVANNTQDSSTIDVECNLRKVTVRCTDNAGNLGSSTVYFTINCNHPPTRPGAISPDTNHTLTGLSLTWVPSTDLDNDTISYWMKMGSACSNWDVFGLTDTGTDNEYTVLQTLSYGTGSKIYCMELFASDGKPGGLSLSRIENITIFNTQPTATSSATDQADVGQNITFNMDWSDADSDQVKFFVCRDNSCSGCSTGNITNCFCTISFTGTSPASCSYTAQQSDSSTVDYWYSMCDNTTAGNNCTGVFAGNDTSFNVNHKPSVPVLIPASDTHTTSTLLSWNPSSDSDSDSVTYDVRVSDIDGGNHTFAQSGLSGLNVTATNITIWEDYADYYWSAMACDEHWFCSDWNLTSDIFVRYNNPPDAPSNLTPTATHNTTPLLNWTVNSDPDNDTITTYVCISSGSHGYGYCDIDGGWKISTNGQYQVNTTLQYHQPPYYVRLINTDNTGASDANSTPYDVAVQITNYAPSSSVSWSDNNKGWGESWSVNCTVSDQDADNLTVRLYSSTDNSTWQYESQTVCNNCGSPTTFTLPATLDNTYIDESYFRCEADDSLDPVNSTKATVTVEKDDVQVTYEQGNAQEVNRAGTNSVLLKASVQDTDRGVPVEADVNGKFWVEKDGSNYDSGTANTTDAGGYLWFNFNPDGSYQVGEQNWTAGTAGDEYYKNANLSSAKYLVIKAPLTVSIQDPGDKNVGDQITIRAQVADEVPTPVAGLSVTFELSLNGSSWESCTPVKDEGTGWYNCTWNSAGKQEGNWDVRVNASGTYYYSGSETQTDLFFLNNQNPSGSSLQANPEPAGWGERIIYSAQITDPENDQVTCSLWVDTVSSDWTLKNTTTASAPYTCSLKVSDYVGADVGQVNYKFELNDTYNRVNTTEAIANLEKDDVAATIKQGNGGSVERDDISTITLIINIYDTDKPAYPSGTPCFISVTKDGSEPYDETHYNTTDENGNCTWVLDPDSSYSIGTQRFIGGTDSSNPYYKAVSSSQGSFTITDTQKPTYSEFDSNTTQINNINESILMWSYWSDNEKLNTLTFSWNLAGSWVNESTSTSQKNYNYTKEKTITNPADEGKTVSFKFYANDTSGNWDQTGEKSFTIPNKAPKYSNLWVSVPNTTIIAKGTVIGIGALWTDNFQLDQTWLNNSYEGINYTNHQSGWSNYTITAAYPVGTQFTATIYANDTVNNVNFTESYTWTIDNTAPSIINELQYPETVYNDNNLLTNATITDTYLSTVWIEGNWTNSWENITVTDHAGDVYYYTVLKGNFSNQENVWWRYWASDTSGNLAAGEQKEFTVANRLPSVTSINIIPSTAYKNSTLTCENTLSDLDGETPTPYYMWYRNGTGTGQTAQNLANAYFGKSDSITCQVTPWDGIQNGTAVNATPVIILNSPPTMPTNLEPNKTHDNTPSITWNASYDIDNDKIYYWIKIGNTTGGNEILDWTDTGDDTEYTVEKNLTFPAIHYLTIEARDGETISWNQLTINITNFQPSDVTLYSPDNYYNTTNNTPTLTWNASSDGDVNDTITYYVMVNSTVNSTMQTSFITDTLVDGTYLWKVKACDNTTATNNCTSYTTPRTFTVDTAAPTGGTISYYDGYRTQEYVMIALNNGTDATTGVKTTRLYYSEAALSNDVCGAFTGWTLKQTDISTPYNFTLAQSGKCYNFTFEAEDYVGLATNYSNSNITKIDTSFPTGGSIDYAEKYYTTASVQITLTQGSDSESGIQTTYLWKKNTTLADGNCAAGSWTGWYIEATGPSTPYTDTNLQSSYCYNYTYEVKNNAGLSTNYSNSNITKIDTIAPQWQTQLQSSDTYNMTSQVEIYLSAEGFDANKLDTAVLATNETSSWANRTTQSVPGSGTWVPASFTWNNTGMGAGQSVEWKIWFNDTAGNWNVTDIKTFVIVS